MSSAVMTADSPKAFLLSATLHAGVAALLMWAAYVINRQEEQPKIFELVAGEGDNFMAREAPALGTPGATLKLPQVETPLEPVTATPPSLTPVAPPPVPNWTKQIKRDLTRAEATAKQQIAQQRAAEERLRAEEERRQKAEEERRKAAEAKKMTKAEFDAKNKSKTVAPKPAPPPKIAKINVTGITKGVSGGSVANKTGGAGGKALTANEGTELERYFALFKQRLKAAFEPPPGLSDTLEVRIRVQSNADGSLSGSRVVRSSGSEEFDRAVLDAVRRVMMPARPDRRSEAIEFPFAMRELIAP
jgi:colicin import membrane protein